MEHQFITFEVISTNFFFLFEACVNLFWCIEGGINTTKSLIYQINAFAY